MTFHPEQISLVAFDLVGTVLDVRSYATQEEIDLYVKQIRLYRTTGIWRPLELPTRWEKMPAFPDARKGLLQIPRSTCTCTNLPMGLVDKIIKYNNLSFDLIVPIEANHVYKDNPLAYQTICQVSQVDACEVLFVTANEGAGDLEGAVKVGMQSVLIRNQEIPDIISLAERLK